MLLPSPGLSMKAHVNLLDNTGCRTYICTDASEFVVRTFETEWKKLRISHIPHIDDWFNNEPTEPYKYNKAWEIAKDEPTLIFPTGGTTGNNASKAHQRSTNNSRSTTTDCLYKLHDDCV